MSRVPNRCLVPKGDPRDPKVLWCHESWVNRNEGKTYCGTKLGPIGQRIRKLGAPPGAVFCQPCLDGWIRGQRMY